MTPQERLDYLFEKVIERKHADMTLPDTAWATGARGLRDFGPGPNGWGGMIQKLRELGYGDVADQLVYGMDFGDPRTQSMLDSLARDAPEVFTPDRVQAMKEWGVTITPRWKTVGYATPPTLQMIQSQIEAAQKYSEIERLRNKWDDVATYLRSQIEVGEVQESQIVDSFLRKWSES